MYWIEYSILGAVTSAFAATCAGIAIWLVIGRTAVVYRLIAFAMGLGFLGLGAAIETPNSSPVPFLLLLGLATCVILYTVGGWGRQGSYVLLAVGIFGLYQNDFMWSLDVYRSKGFGIAVQATIFFAMWIAVAQFAYGLRITQLFSRVSDMEMELATGKTWDEWKRFLDAQNAQTMKHAEIVAILKTFGIRYEWIKVVAKAYLKSCGRREFPTPRPTPTRWQRLLSPWFIRGEGVTMTRQFSIGQLLLLTIAAACLFQIATILKLYVPDMLDLAILVPVICVYAAIALLSLESVLARRVSMRNIWIGWVACGFIVVIGSFALGAQVPVAGTISHGIWFAIWVNLAANRIKDAGYRIVSFEQIETSYDNDESTCDPPDPDVSHGHASGQNAFER